MTASLPCTIFIVAKRGDGVELGGEFDARCTCRKLDRRGHLYSVTVTEHILATLVQFVIWTISSTGYTGVGLLMAIESACIPLPSEIIMPFAGYLVSIGRFGGGNSWMGLFWVATAGGLGCNLGSVVGYWIGAIGGRPLVEAYGKYVLMSRHDLDRMTRFFESRGAIT